jgi:hypothetical protein
MSELVFSSSIQAKAAISKLFENTPPVLVEVRFPHSGTSPDWYLCEEEEQFQQIVDRLHSGVELHLSSVWDLKDTKGGICMRK